MDKMIDTSQPRIEIDLPAMTLTERMQLMGWLWDRGFLRVSIKNNDALGVTVTAAKHG